MCCPPHPVLSPVRATSGAVAGAVVLVVWRLPHPLWWHSRHRRVQVGVDEVVLAVNYKPEAMMEALNGMVEKVCACARVVGGGACVCVRGCLSMAWALVLTSLPSVVWCCGIPVRHHRALLPRDDTPGHRYVAAASPTQHRGRALLAWWLTAVVHRRVVSPQLVLWPSRVSTWMTAPTAPSSCSTRTSSAGTR